MTGRKASFILWFLLALAMFSLVCNGCGQKIIPEWMPVPGETSTANESTPATATTEAQTVSPRGILAEDEARMIAEDFIRNSHTFLFDGIENSITFTDSSPSPISAYRARILNFKFQTRHPGYGDRTGQFLAEVITNHTASIWVNMENGTVVRASSDNTWDMMEQKELPVTIGGVAIGGGETKSQEGLPNNHRTLLYTVLADEGYFINIRYIAYPSSVLNESPAKFTLDLYDGDIKPGDRIEARGTLDKQTNMLVVAENGDFIKTYPRLVTVTGAVVSVRDTIPAGAGNGLQHDFELLRDDGTFIHVACIAGEGAAQSLFDESVHTGDYMKAAGIYDRETCTLVVSGTNGKVKTYDRRVAIGE